MDLQPGSFVQVVARLLYIFLAAKAVCLVLSGLREELPF